MACCFEHYVLIVVYHWRLFQNKKEVAAVVVSTEEFVRLRHVFAELDTLEIVARSVSYLHYYYPLMQRYSSKSCLTG